MLVINSFLLNMLPETLSNSYGDVGALFALEGGGWNPCNTVDLYWNQLVLPTVGRRLVTT